MVVLCSNVNGASVLILLVLIVHYKVQVTAPLLHHPRCLNLLESMQARNHMKDETNITLPN